MKCGQFGGPLPLAHMAKILRTIAAASSSTISFFVLGPFGSRKVLWSPAVRPFRFGFSTARIFRLVSRINHSLNKSDGMRSLLSLLSVSTLS